MNVNIPPHPPTPSYVVPGAGTSLYIHISYICIYIYIYVCVIRHDTIYSCVMFLVYSMFDYIVCFVLYVSYHGMYV